MVVWGVWMRYPLNKCQFSAILAEDLIKLTASVDSNNNKDLHCAMPSIILKINQRHFPTTNIDTVRYICSAICLLLICDFLHWGKRNRKFENKNKAIISEDERGGIMQRVSNVCTHFSAKHLYVTGDWSGKMTCFKIMHIKDMENLRNWWELNRNPMRWV